MLKPGGTLGIVDHRLNESDDSAKEELEARLVDLLKPGGYLYIGHSERLIGPAVSRMKSCGNTIYQRTDGAA